MPGPFEPSSTGELFSICRVAVRAGESVPSGGWSDTGVCPISLVPFSPILFRRRQRSARPCSPDMAGPFCLVQPRLALEAQNRPRTGHFKLAPVYLALRLPLSNAVSGFSTDSGPWAALAHGHEIVGHARRDGVRAISAVAENSRLSTQLGQQSSSEACHETYESMGRPLGVTLEITRWPPSDHPSNSGAIGHSRGSPSSSAFVAEACIAQRGSHPRPGATPRSAATAWFRALVKRPYRIGSTIRMALLTTIPIIITMPMMAKTLKPAA